MTFLVLSSRKAHLHGYSTSSEQETDTYVRVQVGVIGNLKVVTSEKIGGLGVISTLGTWYGGVVMGVLLPFKEAAILDRHFNSAPLQKQNIIVFAANNSRCCECHVAPTIILYRSVSAD
jgi:hypothetical protein